MRGCITPFPVMSTRQLSLEVKPTAFATPPQKKKLTHETLATVASYSYNFRPVLVSPGNTAAWPFMPVNFSHS